MDGDLTKQSIAILKRRACWDLLPCDSAVEYISKLGLEPASPDVEEMEHLDSHDRLNELAEIISAVDMLASIVGEVALTATLMATRDLAADDEALKKQVAQYTTIFKSVTRSVIANLVDAQLLEVKSGFLG